MPSTIDEHDAEEILKEINHLAYKLSHNPSLPLLKHWDGDVGTWIGFLEDYKFRIYKSDFPLSYDVYLPAWRNAKMRFATTSGEYPAVSALQQSWIAPPPFDEPKERLADLTQLEYQMEELQYRLPKPQYVHTQEIRRTVAWLSSCTPEQATNFIRLIISQVMDNLKQHFKR